MQRSETFDRLKELVAQGDVLISAHGYDEMASDNILATEVPDWPC